MQAEVTEMNLGGVNERGVYPVSFTFVKDGVDYGFRGYVALIEIDKGDQGVTTTLEDLQLIPEVDPEVSKSDHVKRSATEKEDSGESS